MIISLGVVSADDNITQSFDDVQKEIDGSSNDTVKLSGTYSGDKEIKITKSVTIEGDAVLDGRNSTRIISTQDTDLKFKNITFINGYADTEDYLGSGGAVLGESNLEFINCKFINNHAFQGGAVFNMGNTYFINCTFINNNARSGGAVYHFYYDEVYRWNEDTAYADLIIENSTFLNNHAQTLGGAVYALASVYEELSDEDIFCDAFIINTTFINNIGCAGGAACLYIDSNISSSVFENNKVNGFKGMLEEYISVIQPLGSAVLGCADDIVIENSKFTGNRGDYGAITLYESEASVMNCSFKDNEYGSVHVYDSKINVDNKKYTNVFLDNNYKSTAPIKLTTSKVTTTYDSGKKLTMKVVNTFTNKAVECLDIAVKVYTGKKYKVHNAETNEKGIATLKASKLSAGTHKIEITTPNALYKISKITTSVKVTKAKATVKAPKVTAKYKSSKYFKVTLKNKETKKAAGSAKIKIKVYTGKNYKTFTVKTNKKGVAKINTKTLSKGNHKVIISSGDNNYIVNGKSSIKIN